MLTELELPIVLKPTMSWGRRSGRRLQAVEVVDEAEAEAAVRRFVDAGAGVLAQQWVGGRREGVTLFVVDGAVRASFAHVEHRTTPALGGASVVRESIPVPSDLYEPSVRLVTAVGLKGYSEVEFRRDGDGRPLLMEINARVAGPIETAARAGVDFPLMIWRWAVGLPVAPVEQTMRPVSGCAGCGATCAGCGTTTADRATGQRVATTGRLDLCRRVLPGRITTTASTGTIADRDGRSCGRRYTSIRKRSLVEQPTSSDLNPKGVAYVVG